MVPTIRIKKLRSTQGVVYRTPAKGQVHFINTAPVEREFFALVVKVEGNLCDVVPGCFDGTQAGPEDILVPKDVLGEVVMICPEMLCTIPISELGVGIARLDREPYNGIVAALVKRAEGATDLGVPMGCEYLSDEDPRIRVHEKLLEAFVTAQECNLINKDLPLYSLDFCSPRAAAAPRDSEVLLRYKINSFNGIERRLIVLVRPKEGDASAMIVDGNCDPALDLDGSVLVDESANSLGTFKNGCVVFGLHERMLFGLRLSCENGRGAQLELLPQI